MYFGLLASSPSLWPSFLTMVRHRTHVLVVVHLPAPHVRGPDGRNREIPPLPAVCQHLHLVPGHGDGRRRNVQRGRRPEEGVPGSPAEARRRRRLLQPRGGSRARTRILTAPGLRGARRGSTPWSRQRTRCPPIRPVGLTTCGGSGRAPGPSGSAVTHCTTPCTRSPTARSFRTAALRKVRSTVNLFGAGC